MFSLEFVFEVKTRLGERVLSLVGGGGAIFSFFWISFSWVKMSFHVEFHLPGLPRFTRFWWGCDCHCDSCDRVKTKSTPSLLDFD